jgi:hypothetical protein
LQYFVNAVAVFVMIFEEVFFPQEPAHELASCGGTSETAGLLAHEEGNFQGPFVDEPVFLHTADDLNGSQDAADTVIVAAFGDAVGVGTAHHGRQIFPRAPAVADDIAERIRPDFQAGFLHESHEVPPPFPVRGGKGDTVDALCSVGVRRNGCHMIQLCL